MAAPQNFDLFGNPIIVDELLRDRFMEPPFSVLDTKTASWQNRKRAWQRKGIQSELGRGQDVLFQNEEIQNMDHYREKEGKRKKKATAECMPTSIGEAYGRKPQTGVSIFDPALTELMYNWFCPDGGTILDVFAGGSVRGIVANFLGYKYTGIELRPEQVAANIEQGQRICPDNEPRWIIGDSNEVLDTDFNNGEQFDFLFTCPPYMDLEVYSDLEADLSTMSDDDFQTVYTSILVKSAQHLKPGGFAGIVVGEVRDKRGFYKDFVGMTKEAYKEAGLKFYNDLVLLNVIGTAAIRANNAMKNKKMVKIHQNVLIFQK